jgi:hypothetical protein
LPRRARFSSTATYTLSCAARRAATECLSPCCPDRGAVDALRGLLEEFNTRPFPAAAYPVAPLCKSPAGYRSAKVNIDCHIEFEWRADSPSWGLVRHRRVIQTVIDETLVVV